MKKLFLLSLLALTCLASFAQTENEEASTPKSKYTLFTQKSGILVKQEYTDLGKVDGLSLETVITTDVNTEKSVAGVRFETSYFISLQSGSLNYISVLDYDELNACIKALEYMVTISESPIPEKYTEYKYLSTENIKISIFTNKKKGWSACVQTKSYTTKSQVFMSSEDLKSLIEKLNQAKKIIEASLSLTAE
jgi:hypothetical protein